jgi:glycerol kinase
VNVLAIDQGTSSTKALVVADGGEVLARATVAVSPKSSAGGAVEQDPEEVLSSVLAAGRRALDSAGTEVQAVGLANQGETVLRWDRRSGSPYGPALSWQDRRAVSVTRELGEHAESLRALTGLPLDPYFAGPKMTWLRRSEGSEGVVTTIDAWLNWRLAGAFVTDAATASRTLLLDLRETTWSPRACEAFGLDPELQPQIVDCAAQVGETTAFGPPLALTGLAVDQQAALLAQSCFEAGQAKCTYGTGAFILANAGEEPPVSAAGLAACVAWRLRGRATYCLDGQVHSAGSAVDWLTRVGLIGDPAELDLAAGDGAGRDANARGDDSAYDDGVVFVPGLAGLGAPFWAPAARGGWLGLSLASRRGDLVLALIRGIAAQVACLAQAIAADTGVALRRLRVDGGLTRSARLMQAQADLLQVPVECYPSPEATALGVAALARLGAGAAGTAEEAVGTWSPAAVYEPRMTAQEAHERLSRWRAAADAVARLGG